MLKKRRFPRREVCKPALIITRAHRTPDHCTIRDLSFEGARIEFTSSHARPNRFFILDVQARVLYDAEVRWQRGCEFGVRFLGAGMRVDVEQDSAPHHASEDNIALV